MRPTEEQKRVIGRALGWSETYAVEQGQRALEACAPVLLHAPTPDERREMYKAGTNCDDDLARVIANRLKSLLEPERDKAVEEIMQLLDGYTFHLFGCTKRTTVEKIVAAVRAADKGE